MNIRLKGVGGLAAAVLVAAIFPNLALAAWPANGRALCTAPGDQLGPAIASDGAGGAILVWHDRRTFPFNIDAQHVLASGVVDAAWPVNGRAVLSDALIQTIVPQGREFPVVASDGAGGAIVTWPDARNAVTGLDIYAHHILASGVLDPAWPVNGLTVCAATREQIDPVILSDGAGGAFIAWVDDRASTATVSNQDAYVQHVLASGVVDPAWPVNGRQLSAAPKTQIVADMVSDGTNGILVAWTDFRSGNPGSDVYSQHVLGTSALDPAWPVHGFGVSTAPGSQFGPSMIPDGAHGAIMAWTDTRDGTNEIFAQRVTGAAEFAPGWPVDGRAVSIGGVDEVLPTLVSDGVGGAIVAWSGGASGHHTMRAHHVLPSGVLDPAWPAAGRPLSIASSEETDQVIATDGAGGAFVAWQRAEDVLAQHVLASGALDSSYPDSGLAICALPSSQRNPAMVADGAHGAVIGWRDSRDGNDDIYALQVLAAPTVDVTNPTVPAFTFSSASPNPATGPLTLRYALTRTTAVGLVIFNVAGRPVRNLIAETQAAGEHAARWDLRDTKGEPVAPGIYFAQLEVEGRTLTRKLITLQ